MTNETKCIRVVRKLSSDELEEMVSYWFFMKNQQCGDRFITTNVADVEVIHDLTVDDVVEIVGARLGVDTSSVKS